MANDDPVPTKKSLSDTFGTCDILDALVVVCTSLFLLLVVFWLAGAINGSQAVATLPGWLSDTAKTGKAAIGAVGTTAVMQIVRARLGRTTNPQYMGLIVGVFVLLLVSTLGAAHFMPKAQAEVTSGGSSAGSYSPALVRFATSYPQGSNILFVHHYHTKMEETLAAQSDPGTKASGYLAHIDLPADTKTQFDATFGRLITESNGHQPSDQAGGYYDMCLQRAAGDHSAVNEIVLKCDQQDCSIDTARDKGLAVSCSANGESARNSESPLSPTLSGPLSLFSPQPVLAAAVTDHEIHSSLPYWTVPTLDTLNGMKDRQRLGYTRFDVGLAPSSALQSSGSDAFEYQVFVNGQPIYFNGFPPKVFRSSFSPSGPLHLSFGLENLSFSGVDNGYEDLTIAFTFFKGQTQTMQQSVSRKYIALRSADPVHLDNPLGSVQWSGTYIIPANENKYEVLVNSVQKVDDAMQLKTSFDRLSITDGVSPVVLVVRPPLRIPPWYGVAIALVQPTQQVQFTFDQEQANEVCHWALTEGAAKTSLIRTDLRIYQVSNRAYFPCK